VHTACSNNADLTPAQVAAGAREAGLDFIATTEHNTADTHGLWGPHAGDDLLVILGQEATTRTGHWLAVGVNPGQLVDWHYGAASLHRTHGAPRDDAMHDVNRSR
jgi:predicted metal-dependent phosphoesterase TrpH